MGRLCAAIEDQTARALWELENVIACVPDGLWEKKYCGAPLWQHIYHTLHSLDRWMVNPNRYEEPAFHEEGLNDLDQQVHKPLSRDQLEAYRAEVSGKIRHYVQSLTEAQLTETPPGCPWDRFTLILAQFRHLHSHMGMFMGFIIAETGLWPKVLGLTGNFNGDSMPQYF